MIRHSRAVLSFTLLLCLLVPGLTGSTRAQDGTDKKLQAKASEKETNKAPAVRRRPKATNQQILLVAPPPLTLENHGQKKPPPLRLQ